MPPPLHAGGVGAPIAVVGLLLLIGRLVVVAGMLPDAAEQRAGPRPDGRALAGIAADRAGDRADRGATGGAPQHAAGHRLPLAWRRCVTGLLRSPAAAFLLVAALLVGALALGRIGIDLLPQAGEGRRDRQAGDEDQHRLAVHSVGPPISSRLPGARKHSGSARG